MEELETQPEENKTVIKKSKLQKYGVMLSNLSIVCLVCCLLSVFTVIIMPLVWVLGFLLILVTLGIIFAIIPNYWSKLEGFSETINKVNKFLLKIGPYVACVGIVLAIASIVMLVLDKTNKNTKKIVITSIACVLLIVCLVLCFVN